MLARRKVAVSVTIEIDPQQFGALTANVTTLLKNQESIRVDLLSYQRSLEGKLTDSNKILFSKIDSIALNGCAMGAQHEKDVLDVRIRLKELEEKPAKLVAIGSMIIAGLAAIGAFILWIHGLLTRGEA